VGVPPLASIGLMQCSGSHMGYIEDDPRGTVLRIFLYRYSDADPGSSAFLTLVSGSEIRKEKIRMRDEHSGSYFPELGKNLLG
jgi:hypothetical protein